MLEVVFSPLSYLRISHERKVLIDWVYPLVLATLSASLVFYFGKPEFLLGDRGMVDRLLVVGSVLPGFFVAALAAVATFNRPHIDEVMPDPAPILTIKMRGVKTAIRLTRRRMLAHLFAYLCAQSFCLLAICIMADLVGVSIAMAVSPGAAVAMKVGVVGLLMFMFWQLLCVTSLGLYYLGDRLHHPSY